MSYQNYGQDQGQGGRYGQNNPYAQQNVPYDPTGGQTQQQSGYGQQGEYDQRQDFSGQQQASYSQQGGYGEQLGGYGQQQPQFPAQREAQSYPSNSYGVEQTGNGYEMSAMNGDTSRSNDPNAILNACREVHRGIDEVESSVQKLHDKYLDVDKFTSSEELKNYKKEVGNMSLTTRGLYRNLLQRMMKIKADPASGNPRNEKQVGATERRLKGAMNQWQQSDMEYRRRLQDQGRRQYLTINPDASEAEATQAIESSSATNMFQTALLQGGRRDQAESTLSEVRDRNEAIRQVEQDLIELAQMFQDLDSVVVQQEAAVENIDQRGEDVQQNVEQANVQLDGAINSANAARKKKFWCLGIALLILLIIVVIVVVVVLVLRNNNKPPSSAPAPAPTTGTSARMKMVVRELDPDPI